MKKITYVADIDQDVDDFHGRLKIKPMGVCAEPQWITFGSLWKCIKEYFNKGK